MINIPVNTYFGPRCRLPLELALRMHFIGYNVEGYPRLVRLSKNRWNGKTGLFSRETVDIWVKEYSRLRKDEEGDDETFEEIVK